MEKNRVLNQSLNQSLTQSFNHSLSHSPGLFVAPGTELSHRNYCVKVNQNMSIGF